MMSENPEVNFVPYIPEGIPLKVVILAYGMFNGQRNEEAVQDIFKLQKSRKEPFSLTKEEMQICRQYCEIPIKEMYDSDDMHDEDEDDEDEDEDEDDEDDEDEDAIHHHLPIWKVLKYIWEWFNSHPPTYDLSNCFAEVVEDGDLEGLQYLIEELGFEPNNTQYVFDELLRNQTLAKYAMDNISTGDDEWEEFETLYNQLYD
jgi:hypothetical protein